MYKSALFDENTFYKAFLADLETCQHEAIITGSWLSLIRRYSGKEASIFFLKSKAERLCAAWKAAASPLIYLISSDMRNISSRKKGGCVQCN